MERLRVEGPCPGQRVGFWGVLGVAAPLTPLCGPGAASAWGPFGEPGRGSARSRRSSPGHRLRGQVKASAGAEEEKRGRPAEPLRDVT